ncbi:hypothetical protein Q4E93_29630 [Flavitalea sp. BT771]|uniref:hypothetical protein n=1 Tax=Flavitalea sp. BT771 TaxID=3063329 RepID=UPI0026E40883|nr:hypothetical protein [Flavitalea sp. BT771]MDO6434810.1 hypothetical protein [Flavitalea sp. BT771]MDV6223710.1 hypothetical protein [Flavitalea sp. BT771]
MKSLSVTVTEFVDSSSYPGWVRAVFKDVNGKEWSIVDKTVYFDVYETLQPDVIYPQSARIECHIIGERLDQNNRQIFTIDISAPFLLEAEDGTTIFDIYSELIEDCESA